MNNNAEILEAISTFQMAGFSGNYHIIGDNPLESEEDLEKLFEFAASVPFDPSLKTDWRLLGMRLKILEGSPLAKEHPELKNRSFAAGKFGESMIITDLANKVDKQTFAALRSDPFYKDNPDRLLFLLRQIIRDRHAEYVFEQSRRLAGKNVYFWGRGEMFQYKSHIFASAKPVCALDDTIEPSDESQEIRGLPILHPERVLLNSEPIPIVIFSAAAAEITRKIANKYPQYTDIVACAML